MKYTLKNSGRLNSFFSVFHTAGFCFTQPDTVDCRCLSPSGALLSETEREGAAHRADNCPSVGCVTDIRRFFGDEELQVRLNEERLDLFSEAPKFMLHHLQT